MRVNKFFYFILLWSATLFSEESAPQLFFNVGPKVDIPSSRKTFKKPVKLRFHFNSKVSGRLLKLYPAAKKESSTSFVIDSYQGNSRPFQKGQRSYKAATFFIDYNEQVIESLRPLIKKQYGDKPSPSELRDFVNKHISTKNLHKMFDLASEVAKTKTGDCTEHAALLTAVLRQFGYQARFMVGPVVSLIPELRGTYLHAWVEYAAKGKWQTIDAAIDDSLGRVLYLPTHAMENESINFAKDLISAFTSMPNKIEFIGP